LSENIEMLVFPEFKSSKADISVDGMKEVGIDEE